MKDSENVKNNQNFARDLRKPESTAIEHSVESSIDLIVNCFIHRYLITKWH